MRARLVPRLSIAAVVVCGSLATGATEVRGARDMAVSQRYAIVATLDVASGRLDAVETLSLTNRSPSELASLDLSVISRAQGYLEMDEPITVGGVVAAMEWTTGTNLRVTLPEAVAPRESVELSIPFALTVGASAAPFTARLSRENGVISFGEWFPIVSREHDVHGIGDPQVSYTADAISLDLTTTTELPSAAVACPGLVVAPDEVGTHWVCEATDVRDFSFVVNPDFTLTTRTVGDTELRVYTETVSGDATADLATTALVGLGELFGAYPWPDLVIAEIGGGGGFSMEYPRAIHLTRTKVTDPYVVYHEVAHQWFYAQLGNDQMLEPWLDEGFADFSARLLMGIGETQCSTRPVDSTVFAWPAGPISGGDWTSCDGYFHAVFYRGTEFLTAVRGAMGDEAFFDAMRDFVDRYRHRVVTGRRLLDHLARRSDADLRPIYEAYLEGPAAERLERTRGPVPAAM